MLGHTIQQVPKMKDLNSCLAEGQDQTIQLRLCDKIQAHAPYTRWSSWQGLWPLQETSSHDVLGTDSSGSTGAEHFIRHVTVLVSCLVWISEEGHQLEVGSATQKNVATPTLARFRSLLCVCICHDCTLCFAH